MPGRQKRVRGMGPLSKKVLAQLREHGPHTMAEIASRNGWYLQQAQRVIGSLRGRGLVTVHDERKAKRVFAHGRAWTRMCRQWIAAETGKGSAASGGEL